MIAKYKLEWVCDMDAFNGSAVRNWIDTPRESSTEEIPFADVVYIADARKSAKNQAPLREDTHKIEISGDLEHDIDIDLEYPDFMMG